MEILLLFIIMFGLMAFSVPIGFSIVIAASACFALFTEVPISVIAQTAVTGLDSFPMLACPFFILAGALMSRGGLAKRLIDMIQSFVGHLTGGLAISSVVTCMFFGAISGSATATVSSIGGFMIPEMKQRGYETGFCASLVSCAGSLGLFIPPSLSLVFYAVVTGSSIADLFIATVVPGIIVTVVLCLVAWFLSRKYGYPKEKKSTWRERGRAVWDAKWAIVCPVIILGGIYSGLFTPTEAAVVAVVYSIIIGVFVYKELDLKAIWETLIESMSMNGLVMFLLAFATGFARYVTLEQVPTKLVSFISGITDSPILILLMINVLVLLVGCVMDNVPSIMILSPILLPLALQAGLTPVQFGVVMSINTTIGLVTPPYGADLFVGATIAKCKVEDTFRTLLPFVIGLIFCLFLVTYIPDLSTFVLEFMK